MKSVLSIAVAMLIFLLSNSSFAFESWEHKRLGDLAFHIAKTLYCEHNRNYDEIIKKECDKIKENFYDPLMVPEEEKNNRPTYGDLIMCVDQFLTPEKLYSGYDNSHFINRSKKLDNDGNNFDPTVFIKDVKALHINYINRCVEEVKNTRSYQAAHSNHTHFQSELLNSQRTYHALAIYSKSIEENLGFSLIANAISDHYLHDFFAPGHITTFRSTLSDIFATSAHDFTNHRGIIFEIDKSFLCLVRRINKEAFSGNFDISNCKVNGDDYTSEPWDIQNLVYPPNVSENIKPLESDYNNIYTKGSCDECGHFPILNDVRIESFNLKQLDKVLQISNGSERLMFHFVGDGELWKDEQFGQRLIMLISNVNSILDVLESKPSKNANSPNSSINSFKNVKWSGEMKNKSRGFYILAEITPVGKYEIDIGPANIENGVFSNHGQNRDAYGFDPLFGVSFSFDSMINGGGSRHSFTFEMFPLIIFDEKSTKNIFISYGLELFSNNGEKNIGFVLRPALVLTHWEWVISSPIRYLPYKNEFSNPHPDWVLGVRLDQGFSSFISGFVQISRDAMPNGKGGLRSGVSLGAGVELAGPGDRISNFLRNSFR